MLIPAAAFVGWTMLQKATAFDALNLHISQRMRSAVAIIGAIGPRLPRRRQGFLICRLRARALVYGMPVKVLMLDLGETLVHDDEPFPHVPEALAAFNEMLTAEGEPLGICLVSDFTMSTPPTTPEKIAAIFEEYLGLLGGFGLREFFEPVEQRVTLSTHAGEWKPHRAVFEKALERLGSNAALTECLFITEKEEHLTEARQVLGMETLRFGTVEGITDWADAPRLVAARLSPT
jgi:beta-phosphoglucomutase-like phosphatase (HAD superfamily)